MKHLLTIEDLSLKDIESLFSLAEKYRIEASKCLLGKTVINVFFEHSTRTLTSFEVAAKKLGAEVISLATQSSSIKKGEGIFDTMATIEAIAPDFVVVRASTSGVLQCISRDNTKCSFINAGDGCNEHPTQALIDAFTILQIKKKISGLKVAICGDILHSRVAHSNIKLLTLLGAEVRVISPPTLCVSYLPSTVTQYYETHECFDGVDVIMALRIQYERMGSINANLKSEYFKFYGLDNEKLSYAKDDVIVMHPGPINRGVEISSEVADNKHSVILEQVRFSVPIRQAIFSFLASNSC